MDTPWAQHAAQTHRPDIAQLQSDARTLHALAGMVTQETARLISVGQSGFPPSRLAAIQRGITQSKDLPSSKDPAVLQRFIHTFRRLYSMHMQ